MDLPLQKRIQMVKDLMEEASSEISLCADLIYDCRKQIVKTEYELLKHENARELYKEILKELQKDIKIQF